MKQQFVAIGIAVAAAIGLLGLMLYVYAFDAGHTRGVNDQIAVETVLFEPWCNENGMAFRYVTRGHEIKCYNESATVFYRVSSLSFEETQRIPEQPVIASAPQGGGGRTFEGCDLRCWVQGTSQGVEVHYPVCVKNGTGQLPMAAMYPLGHGYAPRVNDSLEVVCE